MDEAIGAFDNTEVLVTMQSQRCLDAVFDTSAFAEEYVAIKWRNDYQKSLLFLNNICMYLSPCCLCCMYLPMG